MTQNFIKNVHQVFGKPIEIYGFKINKELNEDQYYRIEFSSKDFVIEIEKYHRELYLYLYKEKESDNGIDLFNLLDYLKQGAANAPQSNYFPKEKDIEECYRKQLNYMSTVIYENYAEISGFFGSNYEIKYDELNKYWKKKHPELYKTVKE